jgi:hypothetical protein
MPTESVFKFYLRHQAALWACAWTEAVMFYMLLVSLGCAPFRPGLGLFIVMVLGIPPTILVFLVASELLRQPSTAVTTEQIRRTQFEYADFRGRQLAHTVILGFIAALSLGVVVAHGVARLYTHHDWHNDYTSIGLMTAVFVSMVTAWVAAGIAIEACYHFLHLEFATPRFIRWHRKLDSAGPIKPDGKGLSEGEQSIIDSLEGQFK